MPTAASQPTSIDPVLARKVQASIALLRQGVRDHGRLVYASSLGAEAMVLTDLIWTQVPQVDIVSIDTGRLPEETLTLLERLERRYHRRIKLYYPDAQAVQDYVREHGINGFYNSLGERLSCCHIRKVEPFQRAIAGYRAWVTGVRHEQSQQRAAAQPVAKRPAHRTAEDQSVAGLVGGGRSGATSTPISCITARCTIAAIRASVARRARVRSNRDRIIAPVAGGGNSPTHASAVCSHGGARPRSADGGR